jgi:dTDP-D-glucose 4,6-dehydratase
MNDRRRILVTGGAGFIGSALRRRLVGEGHVVVNVDKLTNAGNLSSLREVETAPYYTFVKADICASRLCQVSRQRQLGHVGFDPHTLAQEIEKDDDALRLVELDHTCNETIERTG